MLGIFTPQGVFMKKDNFLAFLALYLTCVVTLLLKDLYIQTEPQIFACLLIITSVAGSTLVFYIKKAIQHTFGKIGIFLIAWTMFFFLGFSSLLLVKETFLSSLEVMSIFYAICFIIFFVMQRKGGSMRQSTEVI